MSLSWWIVLYIMKRKNWCRLLLSMSVVLPPSQPRQTCTKCSTLCCVDHHPQSSAVKLWQAIYCWNPSSDKIILSSRDRIVLTAISYSWMWGWAYGKYVSLINKTNFCLYIPRNDNRGLWKLVQPPQVQTRLTPKMIYDLIDVIHNLFIFSIPVPFPTPPAPTTFLGLRQRVKMGMLLGGGVIVSSCQNGNFYHVLN